MSKKVPLWGWEAILSNKSNKRYEPIPAGMTLFLLCLVLAAVSFNQPIVREIEVSDLLRVVASYAALAVGVAGAGLLLLKGLVRRNLVGYVYVTWRDEPRIMEDGSQAVRKVHVRYVLRYQFGELRRQTYNDLTVVIPLGGILRGRARMMKQGRDIGHSLIHSYRYDSGDDSRLWIRAGKEVFRMRFEDYCSVLESLGLVVRPRPLPPGEILDRQQRMIDELVTELRRRKDVRKNLQEVKAERDTLREENIRLAEELAKASRRTGDETSEIGTADPTIPTPNRYDDADVARLAPTPIADKLGGAGGIAKAAGKALVDTAQDAVRGAAQKIGEGIRKIPEMTLEDITDAKGKLDR